MPVSASLFVCLSVNVLFIRISFRIFTIYLPSYNFIYLSYLYLFIDVSIYFCLTICTLFYISLPISFTVFLYSHSFISFDECERVEELGRGEGEERNGIVCEVIREGVRDCTRETIKFAAIE